MAGDLVHDRKFSRGGSNAATPLISVPRPWMVMPFGWPSAHRQPGHAGVRAESGIVMSSNTLTGGPGGHRVTGKDHTGDHSLIGTTGKDRNGDVHQQIVLGLFVVRGRVSGVPGCHCGQRRPAGFPGRQFGATSRGGGMRVPAAAVVWQASVPPCRQLALASFLAVCTIRDAGGARSVPHGQGEGKVDMIRLPGVSSSDKSLTEVGRFWIATMPVQSRNQENFRSQEMSHGRSI